MAKGAFWSLIEKGGQQGLSFIVFMVLARLLGPEEYGLANLCFIYFALASMIIMGLVDGIVSLQVKDDLRLSSLFWAVMGVGTAISLGCIITARPLAAFMEQPRLTGLLHWFSVIPVLVALSAVPNLLILKELDLKIYALRTIAATIAGGVVGVVMAYRGLGAYAIIGQQVAFYAITNVIVWLSIQWRPKILFNKNAFIEVVKPGLGFLSVSVLTFLDGQAPRFIIGRILGPVALGYFAFVARMQYAITETLVSPPLTTLYPALSQLNKDRDAQEKMAANLMLLSATLLYPILAIAAATAPIYIPVFFGGKWDEAIILLQVFILGAAVFPIRTVMIQLFRSNSKMHNLLVIRGILLFLSLSSTGLLFLPNGLLWTCLVVNLLPFLSQPYFFSLLRRVTGISLWQALWRLWPAVVSATLCYAAIYVAVREGLLVLNPWLRLVESVVLGSAVYLISILMLQYRQMRMLLAFAQETLRRRRQSRSPLIQQDNTP